ncbi:DUF192 domain-containing protein [Caproiciproducens galactitolivorans]|uniref:ACR n=1 Tax=Caproiciproducens galactitolivorans TaxID=642589 RepID=A0A4Z0YF62_9FIRM|nr:DUF192 domain-containing protein [Caproiciproducens galactitolivorans]QEY35682.1 DUF192 domain-containing protein [Caproiciproducens galactitolivorans]TGJ77413.1 hypothetical protein CAGA_07830 [Caproiciproducens galactitolivorans]
MKVMQNGAVIADRVSIADGFLKRLKGLMGKKTLRKGEGLLLENCSCIHTCFMRFAIDVVYFSKEYKVLYVETLPPWRVGRIVKGTKNILELPAHSAAGLAVGEACTIEGA